MFRDRGLVALWAASIVGRLPNGALSLVLLLRTREMTGSYAAGGVVAGAFGLAAGLGQPLVGRIIDRRGQGLTLIVGAVVQGGVLGAFAALPDGTSAAVATLIAAIAGAAQPPLSSALRALLSTAVAPERQHSAFALDSTLYEVVFILGPLLIVSAVGAWSLQAAVAACGVLGIAGTMAFAATRLSREARRGVATTTRRLLGPLAEPGVRILIVAVALFGCSVSTLELGWSAFAIDEGHRSAVGYLFAFSALGSATGGIVAARLPAPADPVRRLLWVLVGLTVLEVPLALVHSLPAMCIVSVVSSLCIAPSLALAYQLTSINAPAGTTTEALTWMSSSIAVGGAAGSVIAGVLAQHTSTTLVLATIAAYTALETAWVALRAPTLST